MTLGTYFLTGLVIGLIWFVISAFIIRRNAESIGPDERQAVFWMTCFLPSVANLFLWIIIIPVLFFAGFSLLVYKWIFKLSWKQVFGEEE